MAVKIDLHVSSDWLVQGQIEADGRFFWYRCKNGTQSVSEMTSLMSSPDSDWLPGRETCLCEASGRECVWPDDETEKLCEPIFSEDISKHVSIAEACVTFLLRLPPASTKIA